LPWNIVRSRKRTIAHMSLLTVGELI
jgi:hypothetical protein